MEQATAAPLKKTPLNARHRASGAKMVPFGGWDMPVEYSGIVAEHLAVRERAGLFDVSHMGEIEIAGKDALAAVDLGAITYYWFAHGEVAGIRATISRTGYTGEDGFEVFVPPASADRLWQAILDAGRSFEVVPCGLGARDTLRLEAAMRLYGNDIDGTTTPLEAGLGSIVGWGKSDFLGADTLRRQKSEGVTRKLVGFEMIE